MAAGLGGAVLTTPLKSGDWAHVVKIRTSKGLTVAAKVGRQGHEHLMAKEAKMLIWMAENTEAPVPQVLGVGEGVLLMEFIEHDGNKGKVGAVEAGQALAWLHDTSSGKFGFPEETIFGPTPQPNPEVKTWTHFFGTHRLLYMGEIAFEAGQISGELYDSLQRFVGDLKNFLPGDPRPALLHGDFWSGNVLFHDGHLAAFIDPAIYFGDQEVDLAFSTLFGSPGPRFFDAYKEIRPITAGFEERIDVYNLWGLLFHAYWFGGSYAAQVKSILNRFGY